MCLSVSNHFVKEKKNPDTEGLIRISEFRTTGTFQFVPSLSELCNNVEFSLTDTIFHGYCRISRDLFLMQKKKKKKRTEKKTERERKTCL